MTQKIVLFDTLEQAYEYFNRDYSELLSRIELEETLILTTEFYSIKIREDGKYWYPALDDADYTNLKIEFL